MDELPWVDLVKLHFMDQPRMHGTTARCLVDLLVVQQLCVAGPVVCPLVQIQVVHPSTGCFNRVGLKPTWNSSRLVSLLLVARLTKSDRLHQRLRKMPSLLNVIASVPRIYLRLFV